MAKRGDLPVQAVATRAGPVADLEPAVLVGQPLDERRGAVLDQDALLAALRSGHIAGAGLDVTEPEPLPADSPLWAEPNVIVTAHSAGQTPRSFERYERLLLDNLGRWQRGERLLNVVDKANWF